MFEKNIIHVILGFSVVFTIFVSFCFILSIFILRKRNEETSLNTVKKKFFGLFMELDDFSIFALAVNFIWILFLVLNLDLKICFLLYQMFLNQHVFFLLMIKYPELYHLLNQALFGVQMLYLKPLV